MLLGAFRRAPAWSLRSVRRTGAQLEILHSANLLRFAKCRQDSKDTM